MACEALKKFRKDRELTRRELGAMLDVSGQTISRWESGARQIGATAVKRVSAKTGIEPVRLRPDLFGDSRSAAQ